MGDAQSTVDTVQSLLAHEPSLGPERVPDGAREYGRLSAGMRSSVAHMLASAPASRLAGKKSLRTSLLKIASLECAAGASADRCRMWFRCIGQLASERDRHGKPADPVEAIVYAALAHEFAEDYTGWPCDLATQQTSERVLYGLVTGKQLKLADRTALFDDEHWIRLAQAIRRRDRLSARAAFKAIADWWLSEYRDAGQPRFDLAQYPCFEPVPNAALALANQREHLGVRFDHAEYSLFYVAALMR